MNTRTFKRACWIVWDELRCFGVQLITSAPGRSGSWLRTICFRSMLRHLGNGTVLQAGLRITNPENVSIGGNGNFAQGVFITGGGGVTIGDWVGIGPDSKIWSVNHRFSDPDRPWILQGWEKKSVVIADDVWLGANVFVMPGVTIGRGAVVSAGTVVTKSIPAYALVAGNPGRVVGWRKQPSSETSADPTLNDGVIKPAGVENT